VLMGAAAAMLGYITLDVLWRISLANYKARKRSDRKDRESS